MRPYKPGEPCRVCGNPDLKDRGDRPGKRCGRRRARTHELIRGPRPLDTSPRAIELRKAKYQRRLRRQMADAVEVSRLIIRAQTRAAIFTPSRSEAA
jgi:hypothetical protein